MQKKELKSGEMIVRVQYWGINASDINFSAGRYDTQINPYIYFKYPNILLRSVVRLMLDLRLLEQLFDQLPMRNILLARQ
jgi:hypothetical protein